MSTQTEQEATTPKLRPTRVGTVTSAARQKTIRVEVAYSVRHEKYGKFLRKQTVYHAHDETNDARLGDTVEIVQTRPISKQKRWRLVRVVQRAPQQAEVKA
jgi:small subunit ribosomal protein S17